jgi:hypothetical protein
VTFTPTDTVDYTTATASVPLVVNPATPSITWADPAALTYGTPLSSTQLDATASVPGTFSYTPAAGTMLGIGSQTLRVTFTPADTTDFTTATANATLVVNNWPTKLAITSQPPTSVTAGAGFGLTVAAEGGTGYVDPLATGTVTLSLGSNPGQATLGGRVSAPMVHGVATFSSLTLTKASPAYTLQASSPGLQAATSASIAVTPAAAKALAFGQLPTAGSVGVVLNPTVTVLIEDAFGNLTTATYPVSLRLANSLFSNGLHGTLTQAAVGGVATFANLSLSSFGSNYVLLATSPGLSSATSAPISISTGMAAQLVLSAPAHTAVGEPFPLRVTAKDILGNVVPTFTGTITVSGGGAFPPFNYTFTASDRGSHTFTLTPAKKGTFKLSVRCVNQAFLTANWTVLVA